VIQRRLLTSKMIVERAVARKAGIGAPIHSKLGLRRRTAIMAHSNGQVSEDSGDIKSSL
jgi:hypothetical protein